MAKIDTQFMTERAEKHTLWGRTYLYSPYKGVPPGSLTHTYYDTFIKAIACLTYRHTVIDLIASQTDSYFDKCMKKTYFESQERVG